MKVLEIILRSCGKRLTRIIKYLNTLTNPMLIKKSETKEHQNSPNCTVWEHNHPTNNLSYATVSINGRYPKPNE